MKRQGIHSKIQEKFDFAETEKAEMQWSKDGLKRSDAPQLWMMIIIEFVGPKQITFFKIDNFWIMCYNIF